MKATQIVGWFDHDSDQAEVLVRQIVKACCFALPVHRLRCAQHCSDCMGDLVEVGQLHKALEDRDVGRVVGIEGESVWIVLSQPGIHGLCLLHGAGIGIQKYVDGDGRHEDAL